MDTKRRPKESANVNHTSSRNSLQLTFADSKENRPFDTGVYIKATAWGVPFKKFPKKS